MNEKSYRRNQLRLPLSVAVRGPDAYTPDLKEAVDDDRAWFAANSGRRHRARLTASAELHDLKHRGIELPRTAIGMVTVVRNFGGSRLRVSAPLSAACRDPADLDEQAAALLYDQIKRSLA